MDENEIRSIVADAVREALGGIVDRLDRIDPIGARGAAQSAPATLPAPQYRSGDFERSIMDRITLSTANRNALARGPLPDRRDGVGQYPAAEIVRVLA